MSVFPLVISVRNLDLHHRFHHLLDAIHRIRRIRHLFPIQDVIFHLHLDVFRLVLATTHLAIILRLDVISRLLAKMRHVDHLLLVVVTLVHLVAPPCHAYSRHPFAAHLRLRATPPLLLGTLSHPSGVAK